jgi:endonuclease YncB( thermonuclease family)
LSSHAPLLTALKLLIPALALMATINQARAEAISGRATVIDGDRPEIHGEPIRILDVDAPESRQTCKVLIGNEWHCGRWAADKLAEWIGRSP